MEKPRPIVKRRHGTVIKTKTGRGFSKKELREAGISLREARKLGLYVDERRSSSRPENVEALKAFLRELKQGGK